MSHLMDYGYTEAPAEDRPLRLWEKCLFAIAIHGLIWAVLALLLLVIHPRPLDLPIPPAPAEGTTTLTPVNGDRE